MGIDAHLQDERGQKLESVFDPHGYLQLLIAESGESGLACLRYIDSYGDTYFNRLQMTPLIAELGMATANAGVPAVAEHGQAILSLANKCQDGVHLYLKFCGD